MASFAKDITQVKLPRPTRVKNKTPAPLQITAEQLLREARERQESQILPPHQNITDPTELSDYRLRLRKDFEDRIRRPGPSTQVWLNYARWEESQKDYARARSVWERALQADYRNHAVWVKYAEFEMRNMFVNSARNVWDRAVALLPRVDQLWYKYIHMEEMLGNITGAREIFERWMKWLPDQQGWLSFINFDSSSFVIKKPHVREMSTRGLFFATPNLLLTFNTQSLRLREVKSHVRGTCTNAP